MDGAIIILLLAITHGDGIAIMAEATAVVITVADTMEAVITAVDTSAEELIPAEQPMFQDLRSAEKMAPELTVADIATVPDQVQSEVIWMAT